MWCLNHSRLHFQRASCHVPHTYYSAFKFLCPVPAAKNTPRASCCILVTDVFPQLSHVTSQLSMYCLQHSRPSSQYPTYHVSATNICTQNAPHCVSMTAPYHSISHSSNHLGPEYHNCVMFLQLTYHCLSQYLMLHPSKYLHPNACMLCPCNLGPTPSFISHPGTLPGTLSVPWCASLTISTLIHPTNGVVPAANSPPHPSSLSLSKNSWDLFLLIIDIQSW